MAIISARKTRLQQKADDGDNGARQALKLAENPNRFLSTVQIGITLIGILSGALGGATIAEEIGQILNQVPRLAPYSEGIGVTIVVIFITFLSLVIGELVPKRLALNNSDRIAVVVSPLMELISKASTPLVVLLSVSTNLTLRILGIKPSDEPEVTEDDLRSMLDQGTENGVFEESEQNMVERIFRLSDRRVSTLITPRTDIIFLDINADHEEIYNIITGHPFSRFPVIEDSSDNIVGVVQGRDLLMQQVEGLEFNLRSVLQQPLFLPESKSVLDALEEFKSTGLKMAIVIDEYGGVMGLVCMKDILEAIVGDVATLQGDQESEAFQRGNGSWLFDGLILVDDLKQYLDVDDLPDEDDINFETLNGFIMAQLRRIPVSGDYFDWGGYRFEVVDMDARRVDKVLVSPLSNHDNQ